MAPLQQGPSAFEKCKQQFSFSPHSRKCSSWVYICLFHRISPRILCVFGTFSKSSLFLMVSVDFFREFPYNSRILLRQMRRIPLGMRRVFIQKHGREDEYYAGNRRQNQRHSQRHCLGLAGPDSAGFCGWPFLMPCFS